LRRQYLTLILVLAMLVALSATVATARPKAPGTPEFDVALIGDIPYNAVQEEQTANLFEEDTAEPSGFADFKAALERETISFGKPVVLVHGDSHTFRMDKPVISERRPLNFTRVETFGSPDVHWVRASVDARDPEVFTFQPEIIEENAEP
jgi:hypothetical protein